MTIKGIETFRAVTSSESEGGAINTVPLQGPGNQLFRAVSMEARAAVLAEIAATFIPAAPKPAASEQGHGTAPSPAEQAYAKAMEKYEAALAKYEADLAAHNSANAQNAAIDKANEPLEQKAAFWEEMKSSLLKVTTHGLAGDSHLSMNELRTLLTSTDPGQRSAADFILSNWDKIPATKLPDWGGCMNTNDMRDAAIKAGVEAASCRNAKQKHVTVPPHPGAPPSPPPAPGATVPTTQTNASTGAPNAGGPPPPSTPGTTSTTSPLAGTSPGLVGLGEGIDGIQAEINRLVEDTRQNPANANANQAKISQLSNQLQTLSALMNQIFTMQSNLSKMLSEMAMTAIRNMR